MGTPPFTPSFQGYDSGYRNGTQQGSAMHLVAFKARIHEHTAILRYHLPVLMGSGVAAVREP